MEWQRQALFESVGPRQGLQPFVDWDYKKKITKKLRAELRTYSCFCFPDSVKYYVRTL